METLQPASPFNFEKQGSFGRFVAGESMPIDFLMTTFGVAELDHLCFAKDIKPTEIDFELLMQRDIDEDRVNKKIVKYLNPGLTEAEIAERTIFFPPLLVAVIPVKGREMEFLYPDEEALAQQDASGRVCVIRDWGGLVRVTFIRDDTTGPYPITFREHGEETEGRVLLAPVKLEIKEAPKYGSSRGVRLVVVDGQHRLLALKKVADSKPELLERMVIPVCIVISPHSTNQVRQRFGSAKLPTVPQVFRRLFVDVNKTAEVVGGHFNILLSDSSMGDLACRIFCEEALNNFKAEGLAGVEWNIRSKKESTRIQRKYSITSIGVMELALRRALGGAGKKGLLKHVLQLSAVEAELFPEDSEYSYPKRVEWDKFSFSQKEVLEKQIREHLVKGCLLKIFFRVREFAIARELLSEVIDEYRKDIDAQKDGYDLMRLVLNQVLEYMPIADDTRSAEAQIEYRRFETEVKGRREAGVNEIIQYAVFQRGMIDAWASMVDACRDDLSAADVTDGFVALLDQALDRKTGIFSQNRRYMQHAVFESGSIKPTEGTRVALANLVLSLLGNQKVAKKVLGAMNCHQEALLDAFIRKGSDSASEFAGHYKKERMSSFEKSYPTDFGIPREDREELERLHADYGKQREEVRRRERPKEKLTSEFSRKVEMLVASDVEQATQELRDSLGYVSDIIVGVEPEEEAAEGE